MHVDAIILEDSERLWWRYAGEYVCYSLDTSAVCLENIKLSSSSPVYSEDPALLSQVVFGKCPFPCGFWMLLVVGLV